MLQDDAVTSQTVVCVCVCACHICPCALVIWWEIY